MPELTAEQKSQVAAWVQAGSGLSDIQKQLASEFGLSMTYMDVRFLVLDLELEVQDREAPVDPLAAAEEAPGMPGMPADADAPLATGGVSVDVDRVTKPGAVVSGTVVFSDGVNASWFLDQMGRLALQAGQEDYRPSEADVEAFQQELRGALESRGL